MAAGDPESITEAAGRGCYQSWDNPAGRTRGQYIGDQIVGNNHLSVAEHVVVNLMCADVPRSTQLETVRHRVGVAYSWESTRYTDKFLRFIVPPFYRGDDEATEELIAGYLDDYERYKRLKAHGMKKTGKGTTARKRAMEAARAKLPSGLGSDGMFSLNGHALRHFIAKRSAEAADLSMREFAYEMYQATKPVLPHLLADATEVVTEEGISVIRFGEE